MKPELDIVSIAYNKPHLIAKQAELVRKRILDAHRFIVVDNSSFPEAAKQIKDACGREKAIYVRSPANFGGCGSANHGSCLNWAWANVVIPSSSQYFGFLDHDMFPIRKTTLVDKIKKGGGMYGAVHPAGSVWYFWPGFCFYDKTVVDRLRGTQSLNFMPKNGLLDGLDTGGCNWEPLYSKVKSSDGDWAAGGGSFVKLTDNAAIQLSSAVKMGDWLHMLNGSEWMPDPNGKKSGLFFEYLSTFDKTDG